MFLSFLFLFKKQTTMENSNETPMKADLFFNLSNIADNLETFGGLKNEVETQRKKKLVTSNEIYLLNIIDSLTDKLIEIHKIILVNASR
jgi:hypothetical protein